MASQVDEETKDAIIGRLAEGRKIEAIKLYREATGAGLKESKDFIDALLGALREKDPQRFAVPKSGCAALILLGALISGLTAWII